MKINLKVHAEFDIDGSIRPTSIVWEDGRVFAIDRILDIRRAASLKAGGMGMRYTCRICGKVVFLKAGFAFLGRIEIFRDILG